MKKRKTAPTFNQLKHQSMEELKEKEGDTTGKKGKTGRVRGIVRGYSLQEESRK